METVAWLDKSPCDAGDSCHSDNYDKSKYHDGGNHGNDYRVGCQGGDNGCHGDGYVDDKELWKENSRLHRQVMEMEEVKNKEVQGGWVGR